MVALPLKDATTKNPSPDAVHRVSPRHFGARVRRIRSIPPMAEAPLRSLERAGFPEPLRARLLVGPGDWSARPIRASRRWRARSGATMVLGPSLEIGARPAPRPHRAILRRGSLPRGRDWASPPSKACRARESRTSWRRARCSRPSPDSPAPGFPPMVSDPTPVAERELREVYFPPYRARDPPHRACGAIVPSRNEIDGVPSHANAWLLKDVLRGEWKYGGTVIASREGIARPALGLSRGPRRGRRHSPSRAPPAPTRADGRGAVCRIADREGRRRSSLKAAQRSITLLANDDVLPLSLPTAGRTPMKIALVELGTVPPMLEELRARVRDRADDRHTGPGRLHRARHRRDRCGDASASPSSALAAFNKPVIVVLASTLPSAIRRLLGVRRPSGRLGPGRRGTEGHRLPSSSAT